MKKVVIALIIAAGVLTTVGGVLLGVSIKTTGIDSQLTSKEYSFDSFSNIDIDTSITNINFKKSADDKCKVECVEKDRLYHEVKVEEDTLKINSIDNLRFYEKVFGYNSLRVDIHLPEKEYVNLKIHNSTGDIKFNEGFSFDSFKVDVSTGKVNLKDIISNSFEISTSTGDISVESLTSNDAKIKASTGKVTLKKAEASNMLVETSSGKVALKDVIVGEHLAVQTSTGDVALNDCDAKTIAIKTSTGDVKGTLLSNHKFVTTTSTGKVNVPNTDGELCEIETSTGDIYMEIKQA